MAWKQALGAVHGDVACVRILDIAGRFGIRDDAFFHGVLTADLSRLIDDVMYGCRYRVAIIDVESDAASQGLDDVA